MKYTEEQYIQSGFYGLEEDDGVENKKEKLVKCRKEHDCVGGCKSVIKVGEHALYESGFLDGEFVSCYTCLHCLDKWLDELLEEEEEEK